MTRRTVGPYWRDTASHYAWRARRDAARAVRSLALALWRTAEHIHPAEAYEDPDETPEETPPEERAASRARHPSTTGGIVLNVGPPPPPEVRIIPLPIDRDRYRW